MYWYSKVVVGHHRPVDRGPPSQARPGQARPGQAIMSHGQQASADKKDSGVRVVVIIFVVVVQGRLAPRVGVLPARAAGECCISSFTTSTTNTTITSGNDIRVVGCGLVMAVSGNLKMAAHWNY